MDDSRVPPPLRAPLRLYAGLVESALGDDLVGVFVHGSIALGAFGGPWSDVDFVTVVRREPEEREARRLAWAHRQLRRATPWGRRFEGVYVPLDALAATSPGAVRRHPYVRRGRYAGGRHRLTAVARLLLRDRGVEVCGGGEEPAALFRAVSRAELDAEMWYNLNVYWAGQLHRPHLYLFAEAADFAVATLPRVLHTLETGEIISKPRALALLAQREPEWRAVAQAALARLEGRPAPRRRAADALARARTTLAFIRAMIARGNGGTSMVLAPLASLLPGAGRALRAPNPTE